MAPNSQFSGKKTRKAVAQIVIIQGLRAVKTLVSGLSGMLMETVCAGMGKFSARRGGKIMGSM